MVRAIALGGRCYFRELLTQSDEGIAANMLSDRLKLLVRHGVLTRRADEGHRQKALYSLTEKGIDLVPVLAHLAIWGRKYLPVSQEMDALARRLEEGGPGFWAKLQQQLRETHASDQSRPDLDSQSG